MIQTLYTRNTLLNTLLNASIYNLLNEHPTGCVAGRAAGCNGITLDAAASASVPAAAAAAVLVESQL